MQKNRQKIYIVPGWGHRLSDMPYRKIIGFARANGYSLASLKVATRNRRYALGNKGSIARAVEKLECQIKAPTNKDIIFGFSIGALMAFLLAKRLAFKTVILGSMSAVLGKDLLSYPKKEAYKIFSKSQYNEMAKMNYGPLKNKDVVLIYGEKEPKILRNRSRVIGARRGHRSIEVKGGDHVLDKNYLSTIKQIL